MAEDKFEIKKEPVYARDESGAKLFGWTWEEMGTVGGAAIFALIFLPGKWVKMVFIALAYIWAKKVKSMFPERFLTNFWHYHVQNGRLFRANAPDTEWRPPIKK